MITVLLRADFQSAFVRFSVPYNSQRVANECFCLSTLYLTQRSSYLLWISFHVFNLADFQSAFVRFSVPYNSQRVANECFCLSTLYLTQRSSYLLWISFHVFNLAEIG